MFDEVRFDFVVSLLAYSGALLLVLLWLRRLLATRTSGRLAQLRFRRVHGARVVELLGGRLDPQAGSPWIDTFLDGRAVQLVAAPLEGRLQAGVALLAHDLPVNVWHTVGDNDELELAPGVDGEAARAIVAELHAAEVDSVACGMPLDTEHRPTHIMRLRFDSVEELPARFERIAPLLARLEQLAPD
jgi:hypothetical protein